MMAGSSIGLRGLEKQALHGLCKIKQKLVLLRAESSTTLNLGLSLGLNLALTIHVRGSS